MKFEWRKHEKALYGTKSIPALVDIPTQNFIMVKGSGNPNDTDFSDRVAALYSLAYTNERPRSKLRGIKRPTSLCSVLACYAAELRGIKP